MLTENVYNGRDNTVDLLLKADGAAVDLSSVTRMDLIVGSSTLSSSSNPSYFDWTHSPPVTGKLVLSLGSASLVPNQQHTAQLIVYDASNANGINWGSFYLDVYDDTP